VADDGEWLVHAAAARYSVRATLSESRTEED
jgi:hypothetical protein